MYPEDNLGSSDMTGEGAGINYNVNFAFEKPKMEDVDYVLSFKAALVIIKVKIW